jgi:hypothetical protein
VDILPDTVPVGRCLRLISLKNSEQMTLLFKQNVEKMTFYKYNYSEQMQYTIRDIKRSLYV